MGREFSAWLDAAQAAGYQGVAMFGLQLSEAVDNPAALRRALGERELELAAVTGFMADTEEWVRRLLAFMADVGCRHLALTDHHTTLTIPEAAERLDRWAAYGDKVGVNVYYHNHTGGVGETMTQVTQLLSALDPAHRHTMVDVGHATKDFAELPPAARAITFLEKHWGEFEYLEFKDWNEVTDLNTPLGEGCADWGRILGLVGAGGYRGWIVVEQNGNEGPSLGRGPAECGRISREFLRRHGL
jgi:sugar phosphate isomerase/epimerase